MLVLFPESISGESRTERPPHRMIPECGAGRGGRRAADVGNADVETCQGLERKSDPGILVRSQRWTLAASPGKTLPRQTGVDGSGRGVYI